MHSSSARHLFWHSTSSMGGKDWSWEQHAVKRFGRAGPATEEAQSMEEQGI